MEIELSRPQAVIFRRALTALRSVSRDFRVYVHRNSLHVEALNDSRTAWMQIAFARCFFSSFSLKHEEAPSAPAASAAAAFLRQRGSCNSSNLRDVDSTGSTPHDPADRCRSRSSRRPRTSSSRSIYSSSRSIYSSSSGSSSSTSDGSSNRLEKEGRAPTAPSGACPHRHFDATISGKQLWRALNKGVGASGGTAGAAGSRRLRLSRLRIVGVTAQAGGEVSEGEGLLLSLIFFFEGLPITQTVVLSALGSSAYEAPGFIRWRRRHVIEVAPKQLLRVLDDYLHSRDSIALVHAATGDTIKLQSGWRDCAAAAGQQAQLPPRARRKNAAVGGDGSSFPLLQETYGEISLQRAHLDGLFLDPRLPAFSHMSLSSKELRATAAFCEQQSAALSLIYRSPGRPLICCFGAAATAVRPAVAAAGGTATETVASVNGDTGLDEGVCLATAAASERHAAAVSSSGRHAAAGEVAWDAAAGPAGEALLHGQRTPCAAESNSCLFPAVDTTAEAASLSSSFAAADIFVPHLLLANALLNVQRQHEEEKAAAAAAGLSVAGGHATAAEAAAPFEKRIEDVLSVEWEPPLPSAAAAGPTEARFNAKHQRPMRKEDTALLHAWAGCVWISTSAVDGEREEGENDVLSVQGDDVSDYVELLKRLESCSSAGAAAEDMATAETSAEETAAEEAVVEENGFPGLWGDAEEILFAEAADVVPHSSAQQQQLPPLEAQLQEHLGQQQRKKEGEDLRQQQQEQQQQERGPQQYPKVQQQQDRAERQQLSGDPHQRHDREAQHSHREEEQDRGQLQDGTRLVERDGWRDVSADITQELLNIDDRRKSLSCSLTASLSSGGGDTNGNDAVESATQQHQKAAEEEEEKQQQTHNSGSSGEVPTPGTMAERVGEAIDDPDCAQKSEVMQQPLTRADGKTATAAASEEEAGTLRRETEEESDEPCVATTHRRAEHLPTADATTAVEAEAAAASKRWLGDTGWAAAAVRLYEVSRLLLKKSSRRERQQNGEGYSSSEDEENIDRRHEGRRGVRVSEKSSYALNRRKGRSEAESSSSDDASSRRTSSSSSSDSSVPASEVDVPVEWLESDNDWEETYWI